MQQQQRHLVELDDDGSEKWDSTLGLFCRMLDQGGELVNSVSFVAALAACSGLAKLEEKETLIKWCSLEKGMALHCEATRRLGGEMELSVANSTVDMYSKCGSMEDAFRVFQSMPTQTVQSFNNLIMGFAECGEGDRALHVFTSMDPSSRDSQSYVAALKACSSIGRQAGKHVHSCVCSVGLEGDPVVCASLVHLYAACASMDDAERVFDSGSAAAEDLVAWNCLMGGYSRQGNSRRVFQLFSRLEAESLTPDSITFVCLLTACAHAGLVEQGIIYFGRMQQQYGIEARAEHLTCLVDVLGRADAVEDAVLLMEKTVAVESLGAWRAVLVACINRGSKSLARLAFQKLLDLSSGDGDDHQALASSYVLASNIPE